RAFQDETAAEQRDLGGVVDEVSLESVELVATGALLDVGNPGFGVLLPLPCKGAVSGAPLGLLFGPDEGDGAVGWKPVGLVGPDYSAFEDGEGDASRSDIIDAGPELPVVAVPVPNVGRSD